MFEIERFLAYLFTPLPLTLILLIIGTIMLFSSKKIYLGKILILISLIILILLTTFELPQKLRLYFQEDYPTYSTRLNNIKSYIANIDRNIKWIVVLAGGSTDDKNLSIVDNLSSSTLKRLIEGIILYKKFPRCKLILSGGNPQNANMKEADYMRNLCLQLGIPSKDIIIERKSKNTFEQVNNIKEMIKYDKFILVSSALHFPRAELMFKKIGMHPIIFPTDLMPKDNYQYYQFLPDEEGLFTAKELIISLWAYLGAWLKKEF